MTKSQKKALVLSRLQQLEKPISLSNLLKILGNNYSERTLRRWLAQWVADNLVEKIGQKRATRYLAKKIVKTETHFNEKNQVVIEYVKQPLIDRRPVSYHQKWFDDYEPNVTAYVPIAVKKQLHVSGEQDSDHAPAGTYARQIYNRLLIDLSYNSSRLEGNTYSLLDTNELHV